MQLVRFDDTNQLDQYFARQLVELLEQAIKQRGHAYMAVSGGKTPQGLFRSLAKTDLDWQQVTITLTDERRIAPTEHDSNERLVKENLLQGNAAKANFISLYSEETSVSACINEVKARIKTLPRFDVVILGMGEDGHTASLFPCSAEITKGLTETSEVLLVTPATAPYQRISLTKMRLLNSRAIFLHLVGERKLIVLNKALDGTDELAMPIRAFLQNPDSRIQVMFAPQ
ncbi:MULTISPECIES: 6-phosphogluconolactonase [unclassified Legionella]|uniref:6-phosphogluconolactonase n=1 Tax=unclassified Legionella TaxID=2622702 RepID=UPI001054D1E8|nr:MULTISPECIES: 6-phosphogluconolactonase [unclassified Legionella]MDI9819862.1 6-phosphogluconolactonase [Legionella sp. PL877]